MIDSLMIQIQFPRDFTGFYPVTTADLCADRPLDFL
jgi:hypothetical protein